MNSHCLCLSISVSPCTLSVSFSNSSTFFIFHLFMSTLLFYTLLRHLWRKHCKERIMVMSSLNEISMGQLVNRVVVRYRRRYSAHLQTFFLNRYLKTIERFLLHLRDIFYQKTSKRETQTDLVMLQKSTFARFKSVTLRVSEVVQGHHVLNSIFIRIYT